MAYFKHVPRFTHGIYLVKGLVSLCLVAAFLLGAYRPVLAAEPPPPPGEPDMPAIAEAGLPVPAESLAATAEATSAQAQVDPGEPSAARAPQTLPGENLEPVQGSFDAAGVLLDSNGNPVSGAELAEQALAVVPTGCPPGVLPTWMSGTGIGCTNDAAILTIQDAINATNVLSGWTVWVPLAYSETVAVDINKSITLAGQLSGGLSFINSPLTISVSNVTISDLTMQSGGSLVAVVPGGNLRLVDLYVAPASGDTPGIDVRNDGGSLFAFNVTVTGRGQGALIGFDDGLSLITLSSVTLINASFSGNTAQKPALEIHAATVRLENVVASDNLKGDGALVTFSRSLTVKNSVFSNNGLTGDLFDMKGSGLHANGDLTGSVTASRLNASGNQMVGAWFEMVKTTTLSNLVTRGNHTNGLSVDAYGAVTLTNVDAVLNGSVGAYVAMTGVNPLKTSYGVFNENGMDGLMAATEGGLTFKYVEAMRNGVASGGTGLFLDNTFGATAQAVSLTHILAEGNGAEGISLTSGGSVTLDSIQGNENGGSGMSVNNCRIENSTCTVVYNVSLLNKVGQNSFNGNSADGLQIITAGAVTLTDLTASSNEGNGVSISNADGTGAVSLTSANLSGNSVHGLAVDTRGVVTLSKVNASNNGGWGAQLGHPTAALAFLPKSVLVSASVFDQNSPADAYGGMGITAAGLVTLNHVSASWNAGGVGVSILTGAPVNIISGLGGNDFSHNGLYGLTVTGKGALQVKDTAASLNGGAGVSLDNRAAAGVVTVTNLKAEGNTGSGLVVESWGAITLNHVISSGSVSGAGVELDNCQLDTGTLLCSGSGNVSILSSSGLNEFNNNATGNLSITTRGAVTLSGVSASGTNGSGVSNGALIDNQYGTGNVSISNSSFDRNTGNGLNILSMGNLFLSKVTASGNGGSGAWLSNEALTSGSRTVTITGSRFLDNGGDGLNVHSTGSITLNNVWAGGNTGMGAVLDACLENNGSCVGTGAVSLLNTLGDNRFNGNAGWGLWVEARGLITLKSVSASNGQEGGTGGGAFIANQFGTGDVIITDSNFSGNLNGMGLSVYTRGAITLSKVKASDNLHSGAVLDNSFADTAKLVSITLSDFNNNGGDGLNVNAKGNLTLNGISASGNHDGGAILDTCLFDGGTCAGSGTITLLATLDANLFSSNGMQGLWIEANNTVTLNKFNAYGNGRAGSGTNGVEINQHSTTAVTLLCSSISGSGLSGLFSTLSGGTLTLKGVLLAGNWFNTPGSPEWSGAAPVFVSTVCK
jgi:hypothetical protein